MIKRLFLFAMLGIALLINKPAHAQVSVNINIGSQPLWGPTGYDHVDYYYMPDIDTYYYVPSQQYVYLEGNRWVWRNSLPPNHRDYDLYNGYKVVMNTPKPWLQHQTHVVKYQTHAAVIQPSIRDSRDSKYYVVKGHPNYNGGNKTVKSRTVVKTTRKTNNGRGNGNNRDNGNGRGEQGKSNSNANREGRGGRN